MTNRALRAAFLVALAAAALQPLLFAGSFAGDAEVHLVFAETASHGRFFEFNPGERVSGETSPGYMLLEAGVFRICSPRFVPAAVKILNLAAWYLFCLLVYKVARRFATGLDRQDEGTWPAVAALAAALMSGSSYNANVGMENGLFAALLWAWIDRAISCGWFAPSPSQSPPGGLSWGVEMSLAGLLGFACWFRPEGLVVLSLAYCYRFRTGSPPLKRWMAGAGVASVIGIAAFAFERAYTGDLVPTSILSRRLLSMHRSIDVGPLRIDPAFVERLLICLPLTIYFALDVRRRRHRSASENFLLLVFAIFFVIYTFITGGAQLSRYIIFLVPILAIGAVRQARREWRSGRSRRRIAVIVATVFFLSTNVAESIYRATAFSRGALEQAMAAPSQRSRVTDDMLRSLGDPTKRPVVLALEPIQVRYELDDRFVIRSVDGRIDRTLVQLANRDYIDHLGYLMSSDIDYFYGIKDYDHARPSWSVTMLNELQPGQTVNRGALTFEMLSSRAIAVHRRPTSSAAPR